MNESTEQPEQEREIYILDEDECPPCDVVKEALKEEIEAGKVKVLKITSDEALALLEEAGVKDRVEFPSALVKDGKGVRYCEIYHSKDLTLSKCGDEIIAIREPPEPPEKPAD